MRPLCTTIEHKDVLLNYSDKVLTAGGVYTMYYFGGGYDEDDVGRFMGAKEPVGKNVTGMRLRIGIALSQDGLHWSRLEGEHPSGCSLDLGKAGDFDELMVGWPQVVKHEVEGSERSVFRMYYTTIDTSTYPAAEIQKQTPLRYAVGLATSEDGFRWTKLGRTFSGSASSSSSSSGDKSEHDASFDAGGVSRRHVIQLSKKIGISRSSIAAEEDGQVLAEGHQSDLDSESSSSRYTMFYEGVSGGTHSVGIAKSADGVTWEAMPQPILEPSGNQEDWDGKAVGSPYVVELPEGRLRMYYVGTNHAGVSAIGCAEGSSNDLTRWTRIQM